MSIQLLGSPVVRALACAILVAVCMAGCGGGASNPTTPTMGGSLFALADGTRSGFGQPTGLAVSRDGKRLYFTARRLQDDAPAVYQLDLATQAVTQLYAGAPLVEPGALAATPDNRSLVIADLAAVNGDTTGTVFRMPVTGAVAPESILAPGIVDLPGGVALDDGGQRLFVTGYTAEGVPAVFQTDTNGVAPKVVAQGTPLTDPAALWVANDQHALLVVDTAADLDGTASVFRVKIDGGAVETLASAIPVTYPAGITTDNTGGELFVTGRTATGAPAVLGVTLDKKVVRVVTTTASRSEPTGLVQSPVSPFVLYLTDAGGTDGAGNILTLFR